MLLIVCLLIVCGLKAGLRPNRDMARSVRELLAQRIRELRREKGWSQEELADVCGLHRTYIGSLERAERNVGVDILGKLAAAFGISVYELLNISPRKAVDQLTARRRLKKQKAEGPQC